MTLNATLLLFCCFKCCMTWRMIKAFWYSRYDFVQSMPRGVHMHPVLPPPSWAWIRPCWPHVTIVLYCLLSVWTSCSNHVCYIAVMWMSYASHVTCGCSLQSTVFELMLQSCETHIQSMWSGSLWTLTATVQCLLYCSSYCCCCRPVLASVLTTQCASCL
jgi:hypothetical protein